MPVQVTGPWSHARWPVLVDVGGLSELGFEGEDLAALARHAPDHGVAVAVQGDRGDLLGKAELLPAADHRDVVIDGHGQAVGARLASVGDRHEHGGLVVTEARTETTIRGPDRGESRSTISPYGCRAACADVPGISPLLVRRHLAKTP